jgi:predicted N-acetyltransferase YhbS
VRIASLDPADARIEPLLRAACAFDRAAEVAAEKLFAPGPHHTPRALGAYVDDDLAGLAAVSGNRIRVLAVAPPLRGRGIGGALLAACEDDARARGVTALRTLDEPGNYLAPGIDTRNVETIDWLARRGWARGDARLDVLVAVRDNSLVSADRAADAAAAAAARGYEVRRADPSERDALCAAITADFGGAWPFEVARALASPSGVHVAVRGGTYCAFAAHDGNNRGLGWFGPTGTLPAHRGQKLGEALLLACLVDVAAEHEYCEVAWIGPRPFYEKVAGIAADRTFVLLTKSL